MRTMARALRPSGVAGATMVSKEESAITKAFVPNGRTDPPPDRLQNVESA
jgi:hypothetical protein